MADRKVLNKYYPPDFDPAKLPKMKLGRDRQYKVRLMAPFHMCCVNCGHYIYKGTKFLAIKENSIGERYLGIQIFRFYIKCPRCSGEITFKTDPKNTDYICEHGAKRNFGTGWRMVDQLGNMEDELEEEEKEDDAMELLEERTKESKREMDILDSLEDIQDLNAKASKVDVGKLIGSMENARQKESELAAQQQKEKEDKELKERFYKGRRIKRLEDKPSATKNNETKRKLQEGDGNDEVFKRPKAAVQARDKSIGSLGSSGLQSIKSMIKAKAVEPSISAAPSSSSSSSSSAPSASNNNAKNKNSASKAPPTTASLVGYNSSDSDSSDSDSD